MHPVINLKYIIQIKIPVLEKKQGQIFNLLLDPMIHFLPAGHLELICPILNKQER